MAETKRAIIDVRLFHRICLPTLTLICQSSTLPFSIIIVGVGNADFSGFSFEYECN
jgi:hypothetical protein